MSGNFRVFSTPSFNREIKKIFKKNKRIKDFLEIVIEILQNDPFNKNKRNDIKKLTDIKQGEGQWRIRLGDYRFRYDIIKNDVILHLIGNRKDIYK